MEGSQKKSCFGILDRVFPMGSHGFREVVPECFDCPLKKECLQEALKTREGIKFRSEIVDRTPARGFVGWLKKWSERKTLYNKLNKND